MSDLLPQQTNESNASVRDHRWPWWPLLPLGFQLQEQA